MYEPVKGVKGWRGYVYGIYTRESFSVSWSYENKKEDFPEEKSSKVNLCDYVKDYRTFREDFQKLVDFCHYLEEEGYDVMTL